MRNDGFYLVEYEWRQYGLPAHACGSFNHTDFEWEILNPNSLPDASIVRTYTFHVADPALTTLDFDFYDPQSPIVTRAFLSVCDQLGVSYRSVPLSVTFVASSAAQDFFFFLPCQSASLLDREKSDYQEDRIVDTGDVMVDRHFPSNPIYSWIRRFSVKPSPLHLFHCIELLQLVASESFRKLAIEHGLKGIKFTPLDENFRYDPWGELSGRVTDG